MEQKKAIVKRVIYRVCIDDKFEYDFSGRMYNAYIPNACNFASGVNLIFELEKIMDRINYPRHSTIWRSFCKSGVITTNYEEKEHMSENVIEYEVGKKGTFIIEVKYRENATWQGSVYWVEGNKNLNFRSALELLKILDSVDIQDEK